MLQEPILDQSCGAVAWFCATTQNKSLSFSLNKCKISSYPFYILGEVTLVIVTKCFPSLNEIILSAKVCRQQRLNNFNKIIATRPFVVWDFRAQ